MTETVVLFRRKTQHLKELEDMIRHHQNIISGHSPMDSCPYCFSDYYAPIEQNKVLLCFLAGATDAEVCRAIEKGRKKASQDYLATFARAIDNRPKKADQDYTEIVARAIKNGRKKTDQGYAEIIA